jgi:DNA-binding transcriptional MerR regulator
VRLENPRSSHYQPRNTDNPWSRLEGIAEGLIKLSIVGIDSPARGDLIMQFMNALKIGAVAKATGLSVKAIRFYENLGLMPASARSPSSDYRLYTQGDVRRLRLVQRAKLLGLRLWQIKDIVESLKGQGCDCKRLKPRLQKLVDEQILEIDRKLRGLSLLREELRKIQKGSEKTPLPQGFCICSEIPPRPVRSRPGLNILGQ